MKLSKPGKDTRKRREELRSALDEYVRRVASGESLARDRFCRERPELMPELDRQIRLAGALRQAAAGVLETSVPSSALVDSPRAQAPPVELPGYDLRREVHRGGQGVVYEALQRSTGRRVAIKVLRSGPFAGESDRGRFEREVHVLAQLRHPNIVTIHDSGAVAGHDFFVMDFVDGVPLDHRALECHDAFRPSVQHSKPRTDTTLKLFTKVCDAVNEAHLRGVIHRDLKPGNILVDAAGEPRVLDFGLAKLAPTGAPSSLGLADEAMTVTAAGQFVGSLPWASPEQARSAPDRIDLRSDVYSLGVILYQLLTGRFPYDVTGNVPDVLDRILHVDPLPPCEALRSESSRPGRVAAPQRRFVVSAIDRDVETIVLKCLAKEPERRYQSAGELSRDIRRYLAGQAIEARRDSTAYVLRKALRRHRVAFGVAAGFALLIVAGLVSSLLLWRQAVEQRNLARAAEGRQAELRQIADRRRFEAETAADFMGHMLSGASPALARGRDTTVLREMLDSALALLDGGKLADAPQAEIRLRATIASVYHDLGDFDAAQGALSPALKLGDSSSTDNDGNTARVRSVQAAIHIEHGEYSIAEPLIRKALETRERLFPGDHSEVAASLNQLGQCLWLQGRYNEAEPCFRRAVDVQSRLEPQGGFEQAACLHNLGALYVARQQFADAEPMLRDALEMVQRIQPGDLPQAAEYLISLGECLREMRRTGEAEALLREALDMERRLFATDHPLTARTLSNLATLLLDKGDLDASEPLYQEAHALLQRLTRGRADRQMAIVLHGLGWISMNRSDFALAEERFHEAIGIHRRLYPGDHPHLATTLFSLGRALASQKRLEEAEALYRETLGMARRLHGDTSVAVRSVLNSLVIVVRERGDFAAVEPLARELVEVSERTLPAGHWRIASARSALGACLAKLQRFSEAEMLLLEADEVLRTAPDLSPERLAAHTQSLVDLYEAWDTAEPGRAGQAERWRAALEALRRSATSRSAD